MTDVEARPTSTRGTPHGRLRNGGQAWAVLAVLVAGARDAVSRVIGPAGETRLGSVGERIAAALTVLLAILVHGNAVRDATGPVWPEDEVGPLGNSWVIAGAGEPWNLSYLPYSPGWSVVIAPAWWFTTDPATVYRVAAVMSALAALAAIAPLAALVRRVGLSPALAVGVSAVVVMAPARSVMSNYVLTENFLVLMISLTAIASARFFERVSLGRGLTLATAVAYTFFTHGRAVPIVVATILCVATLLRRNTRVAVATLAGTVGLTVAAHVLYSVIVDQLYASGSSREASTLVSIFAGNPVSAVRALAGQLWYQVAGWLGLTFLGTAVLAVRSWRALRHRRLDATVWGLLALGGAAVMTSLFLGAALAEPAAVSRVDYWFYGRYLDPFVVPVAALGLAAAVRGLSRRAALLTVCAMGGTALGFVMGVLPVVDGTKPLAVINVAGLLPWRGAFDPVPTPSMVIVALFLAVAVTTLAGLLGGRRGGSVALLSIVALLAVSASVRADAVIDRVNEPWRADDLQRLVDAVAPAGASIAFDLDGAGRAEENRATFWLAPRQVTTFSSRATAPPHELVVARSSWPQAAGLGAAKVASDRTPDNTVWVLPGALQDELRREGLLTRPPDDPQLRDPSYEAEVQGPPPAAVCKRRTPTCTAMISVTNAGRDVWAPLGTTATPTGAVRLVAWWVSDDRTVPQVWDLDRAVLPGEEVNRRLDLVPPDGLVEGPASVRFEVLQEGLGALEIAGGPVLEFQVYVRD